MISKKTNLSVQLVYVTPEVAENYLKFNNKNRKVSTNHVLFLTNEMNCDRFLENGEAIIFDENGELKDGQHRLLSIKKSGKSYFIPIVRGVVNYSMATYDTGKNRTSSDVLTLNGFKNTSILSSAIQAIDLYKFKKSKMGSQFISSARRSSLTNQQVLEYCSNNYDWLNIITTKCISIYKASNPKVLSPAQLILISYLIGGENPKNDVYSFLKHLIGVSRIQETATSYLYTKLYNSKINKEPLNKYWILGMSLKAWNYYIDGNPSVKYFKFSIDQDLPKINS